MDEKRSWVFPVSVQCGDETYVNFRTYGQELLASRNNVQTEYGLLERRDGQPIQRMGERSREQQMGGMTL